jgi:hypothetical protein
MPRRLAVDGLCYIAAAAAAGRGMGMIWPTLSGVISQIFNPVESGVR